MYNKGAVKSRGTHGTLVGNWNQERALQAKTGFTRAPALALERSAPFHSNDRVQFHDANCDRPGAKMSMSQSTYVPYPNNAPDKFFHRKRHDGAGGSASSLPAVVGQGQAGRAPRSQICLGTDYSAPMTSMYGSSMAVRARPRSMPQPRVVGGPSTSTSASGRYPLFTS